MALSLSFLRPCQRTPILSSAARNAHLRLFEISRSARHRSLVTQTADKMQEQHPSEHYPRLPDSNDVMSTRDFCTEFSHLQNGETHMDKKVTIQGILEHPWTLRIHTYEKRKSEQ